jgi:hypothetical protein
MATPGTTFHGVLTGGNGRGNPSVQSTYAFNVPGGEKDIDVGVVITDTKQPFVAFLQDPEGNNISQASNIVGPGPFSTTVNVYKDHPEGGVWTLVLDWGPSVTGKAINTPFTARVDFNKVTVNSNLPSGATLTQGSPTSYTVQYTNTSPATQWIFLDPRTSTYGWLPLPDLNGNPTNIPLPLRDFSFPLYVVPPGSTKLWARLTGTAPVSFDLGPWTGDPDLYAAGGTTPVYYYIPAGGDVTPGFWAMFPSEIGPFGSSGANTAVTATAYAQAWMPQFDPTVTTATSDLWSAYNHVTNPDDYKPVKVGPGKTVAIGLSITPSAAPGTTVNGVINVDDDYVFSPFIGPDAGGDQLASIPYSYTVGP